MHPSCLIWCMIVLVIDWCHSVKLRSLPNALTSLLQVSSSTPSSDNTKNQAPWRLEPRTRGIRKRVVNCKWVSWKIRKGKELICCCCIWNRWKVSTWTSGKQPRWEKESQASYARHCVSNCQPNGHSSCKCHSVFWCPCLTQEILIWGIFFT